MLLLIDFNRGMSPRFPLGGCNLRVPGNREHGYSYREFRLLGEELDFSTVRGRTKGTKKLSLCINL